MQQITRGYLGSWPNGDEPRPRNCEAKWTTRNLPRRCLGPTWCSHPLLYIVSNPRHLETIFQYISLIYIYIYGVCIYVYVYIYIVIYGGCIFFVYMSIGWLFLLEHLSPKRCRQVRHLHCDDHQARCTLVPWGWLLKIDRFPWKPGNHGVNIPLHRVLHAIYCNIINIYI